MDAQLEKIRHSLAHLLAMAVLEVQPDAQLGIGPVIEDGFYYDIDLTTPLTPDDLPKLEERMRSLIAKDLEFSVTTSAIADAAKWAHEKKAIYKEELIKDLAAAGEKKVTFYHTGKDFMDLCKGPHVVKTSEINPQAFALTRIAGAYWRGDEKRPMLTRIYGVAFANPDELAAYQKQQEEAALRDHRKLGQELDLFTFSSLVGPGLPLFTPKGTALRDRLVDKVMSLQEPRGYQRVNIPHITKMALYETSGHAAKFGDDLFRVKGKGNEEFAMKPMNCPHHTQIFASRPRSYRDLPIRYCEVTTCYRDELAGELHGLSRVRSLTQDDGHVFCTADQVEAEVATIFDIIEEFYKNLDMELSPRLSLSDPDDMDKYLGDRALWEQAEATLKGLLEKRYDHHETGIGEAAFYGPKVDFMAKDALGRWWQLATVQLDFNLPNRFDLQYTDADGQLKQPVMIHRAVMGSLERFMSVMIEHFGGKFPFWMAPEQIRIVSIADRHASYCHEVADELIGYAVTVDDSDEKLGYKIRQAEQQKVPVILVVGDKEQEQKTVTVRLRGDIVTEMEQTISVDALQEKLLTPLQE